MTLRQKQSFFAVCYAKLILRAVELGYQVTLGETMRSSAVAKWNEELGTGISHSLHGIRLAGDLNLFKGGMYLRDSESYRELGNYWKSMSIPEVELCWGGDFAVLKDGNHFSAKHEGVR